MGLGGVGLLELRLDFGQNKFLLSVNSPRFAVDLIKTMVVYALDNYYYLVLMI